MAERFSACSVEGCNGNAHYTAQGKKGLCGKHYKKLRQHGDPTVIQRRRNLPPLRCSVDDCTSPATGRKLCSKHYERFRRHGDPMLVLQGQMRHGMSGSRLYGIWIGMRTRCGHVRGANAVAIKHYIGKGIRVCDSWQTFPPFAEWALAAGYTDDMTIDRVDSDRGYEPDNCRWLSMRDNLRARDDRKLNIAAAQEIRFRFEGGESRRDLARHYGVAERTVRDVLAGRLWAE